MTPRSYEERAAKIFNWVFNHVDNNGDMAECDRSDIKDDIAAEIAYAVQRRPLTKSQLLKRRLKRLLQRSLRERIASLRSWSRRRILKGLRLSGKNVRRLPLTI